ncbi:hypothetical protein F7725_003886 [Dissostichus mawsoni]|uniref:Phosphatidic acid phosphatase type 2/haloperoxidase domain-containing protein n=2 Tax=Notothenioidei TaxID=8205 RepID=A0A7J5YET5_DISMA|nr:hypothetical protein F7725_003886 [Dissostichus mawsoni]
MSQDLETETLELLPSLTLHRGGEYRRKKRGQLDGCWTAEAAERTYGCSYPLTGVLKGAAEDSNVLLSTISYMIRRQRAGQRDARRNTERGMAMEEKPGVKSSSSIVPCFLFVEGFPTVLCAQQGRVCDHTEDHREVVLQHDYTISFFVEIDITMTIKNIIHMNMHTLLKKTTPVMPARCSVACAEGRRLNGQLVSAVDPCASRPSALNPPPVKHKTALSGYMGLASSRDRVDRQRRTDRGGRTERLLGIMFYFQLVIMAGTVLLAYYFEYTDTFPVHIQGFFCYDKTFSKPYPGPDEGSKTPPLLIYSLVTAIPTVTLELLFLEIIVDSSCIAEGTQEKTIVTADCCYFNPLLRRIIRFLGNQTPHFLSACRPNYTALGCQSTMQYIAERRACTGNPLVMYVTLVFKTKGTRLTKPTISLTLLCLAVLVGVVRVAEYRNHWADVLAGFFTGGSIAVFLMLPSPPPLRPHRPESMMGMPMVTLPCVESPLEKLRGDLRSPRSHDHQPYRFPATPDVLIPSRSISSEAEQHSPLCAAHPSGRYATLHRSYSTQCDFYTSITDVQCVNRGKSCMYCDDDDEDDDDDENSVYEGAETL